MKLSRLQRKVLSNYQIFHASPPTIAKLMSMSIVAHIAMLMCIGTALALAIAANEKYMAAAIAGSVVGALSRDLGVFIRIVRVWPVLNSIIDWNKVDSLLDGESK